MRDLVPAANKLSTVICDVSRECDVAAAVESLDSWGGLDVIFNNAGIMHADDADAIDTPERIWDLTMAINVKGVWFGSKYAVQSLRKHGKKKGSVINVASVVALVGSATPQLAYTASKGAVLAMTRELAIVHAKEGFRFNALCPAPLKCVSDFHMALDDTDRTLPALHFFKIGSATMQGSATAVRSTFPLVASVKRSNRLRQFCSLPVMRVAS